MPKDPFDNQVKEQVLRFQEQAAKVLAVSDCDSALHRQLQRKRIGLLWQGSQSAELVQVDNHPGTLMILQSCFSLGKGVKSFSGDVKLPLVIQGDNHNLVVVASDYLMKSVRPGNAFKALFREAVPVMRMNHSQTGARHVQSNISTSVSFGIPFGCQRNRCISCGVVADDDR